VRKLLAVAALVAGSLGLTAVTGVHADQLPGGVEGCIASSPGADAPTGLYNGHCSFTATRTGGFVAGAQTWNVQVFDNATPQKVRIGNYSGTGPGCNTAAYGIGNYIEVTVSNGVVAAGNPVPSATDGNVPPSGDACAS
jgi:hypothetical protein